MDFSCILKLSKKQLSENGFKDQAIDHIYEAMMDYLHTQCYKIGFPELVLPATIKVSFSNNFLSTVSEFSPGILNKAVFYSAMCEGGA